MLQYEALLTVYNIQCAKVPRDIWSIYYFRMLTSCSVMYSKQSWCVLRASSACKFWERKQTFIYILIYINIIVIHTISLSLTLSPSIYIFSLSVLIHYDLSFALSFKFFLHVHTIITTWWFKFKSIFNVIAFLKPLKCIFCVCVFFFTKLLSFGCINELLS